MRRGDPAGLGYYLDHGRIHVGDDTTTADQAFAAWVADRAAGLDALLIASTNAQVRELNLRAQAARLAAAAVPAERRVTLADGTTVSDGDVIITRRNDRRLALSATDLVANGDRWSVTSVRPDGALDVRHAQSRSSGSRCPPTTSPSTSSSATPPPSTAPRARPSTPATPS